jgi:hypothetical protein
MAVAEPRGLVERVGGVERQIPLSVRTRLFASVRGTDSAWNRQPWRFVYGQCMDPTFRIMFAALAAENRSRVDGAAALVLATVRARDEAGRPICGTEYELGLAVGGLTAQAHAEGLAVRQYGGFGRDMVRQALSVPDDYDLVVVLGLRWEGRTHPARRRRLPLSELVFAGRWGNPAELESGE